MTLNQHSQWMSSKTKLNIDAYLQIIDNFIVTSDRHKIVSKLRLLQKYNNNYYNIQLIWRNIITIIIIYN